MNAGEKASEIPQANRSGLRERRSNLAVLFVVSTLIGFGVAVYEVALPLFLKDVGLTWRAMGYIYGAGALVTFFIRAGLGAWSDRAGRKLVYVGSLLAAGLATLATPFTGNAWAQAALKSVADPSARLREAMHSVLLYESWPKEFQHLFSRTRGVEFMFHFVGLLAGSALLGWMIASGVDSPERWFIAGAGLLLVASGLFFGKFYREHFSVASGAPRFSWSDLIRMRLTRPMWVMTISMLIFTLGITISHCFALQLFFQEKYGASSQDIFTIGALHRLSSGLTLLCFGHVFRARLRMWMTIFLVSEGIFLAAPGLMPGGADYSLFGTALPALWTAVAVWLAHDFLGMGLWLPIQQTLLQRCSREGARGEDITLSTALGALGGVPAPFIAGWLREMPGVDGAVAVNLPFIVSGAGVAASALALLFLPAEIAAPRSAANK